MLEFKADDSCLE